MAHIARCHICSHPVDVLVNPEGIFEFCPSCNLSEIPQPITAEQEHDLEERCIALFSALKGWS